MDTYDGYVFQIVGDAFCVAFHSASDALNAALNAQWLLAKRGMVTCADQCADGDSHRCGTAQQYL